MTTPGNTGTRLFRRLRAFGGSQDTKERHLDVRKHSCKNIQRNVVEKQVNPSFIMNLYIWCRVALVHPPCLMDNGSLSAISATHSLLIYNII